MRALLLLSLLAGCLNAPRFASVCEQANDVVQHCGASVPFLADTPCSGIARFASQCVVDQVNGCDDLASLMRNLDRCFPDAGAFPEAESLPFPSPARPDGGSTP